MLYVDKTRGTSARQRALEMRQEMILEPDQCPDLCRHLDLWSGVQASGRSSSKKALDEKQRMILEPK